LNAHGGWLAGRFVVPVLQNRRTANVEAKTIKPCSTEAMESGLFILKKIVM
jgi:hypothetical protein